MCNSIKVKYMNLQYCTPEDYLELIGDWEDPNPKPIIEEHNGFTIVRDDLLGVGSKARFIDFLIKNNPDIDEWVYGCAPRWGYGSVSAAYVCQKYGKKFTVFIAKSKEWHPSQVKAASYGANFIEVNMGMMVVTQARAKEYAARGGDRVALAPFGLGHDTCIASIIKVAREMPVKPKEFWSVGGSGTLNRGLQLAWPEANANIVQLGHKLTPEEYGRATVWESSYKFSQKVKDKHLPPYPSILEYDAKLWEFKDKISPGSLIWNVA